MTDLEQVNPMETFGNSKIVEDYKFPGIYTFLKILEFLLFSASAYAIFLFFVFAENQQFGIYGIALFCGFIFVFLTNLQLGSQFQKSMNRSELVTKSEIQDAMLSNDEGLSPSRIYVARTRALKYCQELIDDYKRTRRNSRNIYYTFQILTVVLSGITPILVVVERLESGYVWFKWLPVIFPAISAIISSIITSFPFQKNWLEANKIVELLEAEQEKFVLGITPAYRCYDIADVIQRQHGSKQAIENFITQVNSIHLQQIQSLSGEKQEIVKSEETKSS